MTFLRRKTEGQRLASYTAKTTYKPTNPVYTHRKLSFGPLLDLGSNSLSFGGVDYTIESSTSIDGIWAAGRMFATIFEKKKARTKLPGNVCFRYRLSASFYSFHIPKGLNYVLQPFSPTLGFEQQCVK